MPRTNERPSNAELGLVGDGSGADSPGAAQGHPFGSHWHACKSHPHGARAGSKAHAETGAMPPDATAHGVPCTSMPSTAAIRMPTPRNDIACDYPCVPAIVPAGSPDPPRNPRYAARVIAPLHDITPPSPAARRTTARRLFSGVLGASALAAGLTGCIERRIEVTSTPPGALVWLNDREIGRTPCGASFKFYGEYDVRLSLDGYETLQTSRTASAPFYEYPGPDLVAEALPVRIENVERWHFDLTALPERTLPRRQVEDELLDRAQGFRAEQTPKLPEPPAEEPKPAQAPKDDQSEPASPTDAPPAP
ncbi:MAG: PEGA domain-containing protein [Phycisphaerales bacterium]|nr:PEGA domain-containing protein [Phycisphaerales bacterium]